MTLSCQRVYLALALTQCHNMTTTTVIMSADAEILTSASRAPANYPAYTSES